MAYTAADLQTIQRAQATIAEEGVARVTIGGESIEVLSLDALARLEARVRSDLAAATTGFGLRRYAMKPPGGGG